jgi:hypothetical protein
MITGVSLKGSEAALVLLQQHEEAYHPIALALTGQYDRLGSIDMIGEDDNTELILRYFLNQLRARAFVVREDYLRSHESFPIETVEHLLHGFERNMNDHSTAAVLNGQRIVFALCAATVWNEIARSAKAADDRATFDRLFGAAPVPREIYGERLSDVSQQLREFAAVSNFLAGRNIPWTPATDVSQHYGDDMREYLEEARASFHDAAFVLEGLKAYEREVSDLLED